MRTQTPIRILAWVLALIFWSSPAAAQEPAAAESERGFVLRSADRNNSLRVLGLLQPQFVHHWAPASPDTDALFVNRARVGLLGTVISPKLRYMIVTDFGGEKPRLLFLNVDYTFVPDYLRIRVGQFKRPFSRSFITLASQVSMIDRPSTVGPARFGDDADVGVMVHNEASGPFEYAVGVFNGVGPGVVPDHVHPLLALRVGYNSRGLDPYVESDLEGGAPRIGVAAAGLVDLDGDGDNESFTSALVDVSFKAQGFALSTAVYVGSRQAGPRWFDQRLGTIGHHTQLGYVIANRLEPVARYSVSLSDREGSDHHDVAGGLNVFFHGHAFKWQNIVSVRFQSVDGVYTRDVRLQSQLSLAF